MMIISRIQVAFTSLVKKRLPFSLPSPEDVSFFKSLLKKQSVLTDQHDIQPFNTCYLNMYHGQSKVVLLPQTTSQVSKILHYCNSKNLAVVPQGGNTGLVGGSVPLFDEIILSLRKMNRVEAFDKVSGVLSCQAGCVLERLNEDTLQKYGYEVPLDLGAKGSCQIGGNASTHAAGKYFIKYGPLRGNIIGMEAILADGTVLDMRSTIRKDNTGIDLKQLFIGSEGTLGIITKLDINCSKVDTNRQVILLKTTNFQNILTAVQKAKQTLGKNINAMQYLDGYSYCSVAKYLHPSVMPVKQTDHLLLIELTTEDISEFLSSIPDFDDSIMSTNDKQYKEIWRMREDVAEAANKIGLVWKYDISFNIRKWNEFVERARSKSEGYVLGYGHIGDGNLHLNICLPRGKQPKFDEKDLFQQVVRNHGSISAQHGLGQRKPQYLHLQKSAQILHTSNSIKKMLDPKGILNPYKVYDLSIQ